MLQVDPTFLMTRRGQEWVRRASIHGAPPVWCSCSYVTAACRPEGSSFGMYRPGIGFWSARQYLPPDLVGALLLVRGDEQDLQGLRFDNHAPEDVGVLLDIWHGLLNNQWLVARRPASFDGLVQAGITLVVRGASEYLDAFFVATSGLSPALADALDRRTRFLAGITEKARPNTLPILSVYDCGRSAYR